jgi:hypothetical protein
MQTALDRLRAAEGSALWRDTVVESSAVLSRGIAHLLGRLTSPETHLRAQRFAKVKIAEIQLYQADRVKTGQAARDIYSALRPHIDEARTAFASQFLTPANGTPDYLHQEMVRTLAHNDEALLGPLYPGPLA